MNSFAKNWLAKKYALQLNTKHLGVAKSLAVFSWVKVCVIYFKVIVSLL